VALTDESRERAAAVYKTIAGAFDEGFFPAAPAEKACERCDFRRICGPHEQLRVSGKKQARLEPLAKLRRMS
jgi:hypothetical protein